MVINRLENQGIREARLYASYLKAAALWCSLRWRPSTFSCKSRKWQYSNGNFRVPKANNQRTKYTPVQFGQVCLGLRCNWDWWPTFHHLINRLWKQDVFANVGRCFPFESIIESMLIEMGIYTEETTNGPASSRKQLKQNDLCCTQELVCELAFIG